MIDTKTNQIICNHPQPSWMRAWAQSAPELLRNNTPDDNDRDITCALCRAERRAEREAARARRRNAPRGAKRQRPAVDPRQIPFRFDGGDDE